MILRGALPGRKPGTLASVTSSLILLVEPLVDVVAIDGDLDVLLARADVLDLDGLVELLGFVSSVVLPLRPAALRAFAVRSAVAAARVLSSSGRVSSVMGCSPPEVKKAEKARETGGPSKIAGFAGLLGRKRAGDGARTHDSHVGNVALYH